MTVTNDNSTTALSSRHALPLPRVFMMILLFVDMS